MLLAWLVLLPFIAAWVSLVCRNDRLRLVLSAPLYAVIVSVSLRLVYLVCTDTPVVNYGRLLRADALSAFFVLVISCISFASLIYSKGYLAHSEEDQLSPRKKSLYYFLFHIFVSAMLIAVLVDNLGHLWVAIEMTTLASTFLVGFYNNKTSVEAAWKYLIICSVGITIALLGTVLFYYNAALYGGIKSLDWSDIVSVCDKLDPRLLKVAFLFVFIGYGTKAGLVPMHTWLPDAHSQAMTPISALLSGVLLKTSLYALLRFVIIVNRSLGSDFVFTILIYAGLLSVGVASLFVLVQKDLKRMLAYSSIENIGLIVFGLGIGSPLAITGALFHIINHACSKSLLFFCAGNVVNRYKTHNMHLIQGVIQALPFTGVAMLIGMFAVIGMPPFAVFISKLCIIIAVLDKRYYLLAGLLLLFVAIVFAALLQHLGKVVFGNKPKNIIRTGATLSEKVVFSIMICYLLAFGVGLWPPLQVLLGRCVDIIRGI